MEGGFLQWQVAKLTNSGLTHETTAYLYLGATISRSPDRHYGHGHNFPDIGTTIYGRGG